MSLFDIYGNRISTDQSVDISSLLKGATWLPIGDSITTQSTYRAILSDYHEMSVIGGGFKDGLQAGYASGENNCVLSLVDKINAGTPDIITIALGTNDYGNGCPIGTINDKEDEQTSENFSFMGCYKKLIKTIYEKYDKKPIVLLTPFPRVGKDNANKSGNTLSDYADAIKEIGAFYSLHVVDLYRESGVPVGTLTDYSIDTFEYTSDGLHINKNMGKVVAPVIAKIMELAMTSYEVACTSMIKSANEYTLTSNSTQSIYVVPFPGGTTDEIVWTSENANIVTVVGNGNYATLNAVANGNTNVIAKCGSIVATFEITVA